MNILQKMTNAFPWWVLACSLLALVEPRIFTWFSGALITIGLGIIMLGMGLTLSLEDFKGVLKYPGWVATGVILQYTVMPLLGYLIGIALNLSTPFAVGLILVACCPGGTASNVVTYLAKANLSLSVTMTAISTLLAVILTPILTTILVGSRVEVNTLGLLINTFQVVILPITAGILLNRYSPRVTQKLLPFSPFLAVIFITLIVASIVGAGRAKILDSGASLVLGVFLLHSLGFTLGYIITKILFKEVLVSRTVSIEVGMQNSGLGVVLARGNFVNPAVAIPSAISSVFHCLIGSLLAARWRKQI